jgi:hypothetical protein
MLEIENNGKLNNSQNLKTVPPGSVATLDFLRHHQRHLFLQQLTEISSIFWHFWCQKTEMEKRKKIRKFWFSAKPSQQCCRNETCGGFQMKIVQIVHSIRFSLYFCDSAQQSDRELENPFQPHILLDSLGERFNEVLRGILRFSISEVKWWRPDPTMTRSKSKTRPILCTYQIKRTHALLSSQLGVTAHRMHYCIMGGQSIKMLLPLCIHFKLMVHQ